MSEDIKTDMIDVFKKTKKMFDIGTQANNPETICKCADVLVELSFCIKRLEESKMQQMRLKTFCETYDLPKNTVLEWVHDRNFPAFKHGGIWLIDIPMYEKWRVKEHQRSYKYA